MNKKEFMPLIILGVVAFVIVMLGYFGFQKFTVPQEVKIPQDSSPTPTTSPAHWESTFSYPYPLTWKGGAITYSLVKAFIGDIAIPPDAQISNNPTNRNLQDDQGKPYPVGSKVFAMILYIKASEQGYNNQYDPYYTIKRIVNTEGDIVGQSMQGIASTLGPTIMADGMKAVEVWFIAPEGTKDFSMFIQGGGYGMSHAGDSSDIKFDVSGQSDGSAKIDVHITPPPPKPPQPTELDARRATGLSLVQYDLELYYNKYGHYPISRVDVSDWASLQNILKNADIGVVGIPDDPARPARHYQYISNSSGDLYVLGAILDDINSPFFDQSISTSSNPIEGGFSCSKSTYCVGPSARGF